MFLNNYIHTGACIGCGHCNLNEVAFNISGLHGCIGIGAFHLNSFIGGAAYGIPK